MMLYRLIAPFACFTVRIGERELLDPVRVSEKNVAAIVRRSSRGMLIFFFDNE